MSPQAIKDLRRKLLEEVRSHSYMARSELIEDPLTVLDLDMKPRVGWVRNPLARKLEPTSEKPTDIVEAFASSERRLLIVGEPGSGKTMAAYRLIDHLDTTEVRENEGETDGVVRPIPLLVNLSAWEDQDDFETFLVDYLCNSSVGYGVRERTLASAFVTSRRYSLILDGLDEVPAPLRMHFSERLNAFVRKVVEVAVVVTCRTPEYEQLRADYPEGLGLVQAVEVLPLTDPQLDEALVEPESRNKDWKELRAQRHLPASQQVRGVLRTPLFLNLAVVGHLHPRALLECGNEQELRDLVLNRYLKRILEDQSDYEPKAARRYLTWIARFLNKAAVSPFGLESSDPTVFDLADLTPPQPPRLYQLFVGLVGGW